MTSKNIGIITYSLGNGGAEKVAALQSKMLHNLGHNVFIISVIDDISYPFKGTVLNLGSLKKKKDNSYRRFKRLLILKKFFRINNIDIIIDHRSREKLITEILLFILLFRSYKVIFIAHNYNLYKVFPQNIFWTKKLFKNQKNRIVCVSKSINDKIKQTLNFKNTLTIYNPIEVKKQEETANSNQQLAHQFILYFGRLDNEQKDLNFLIKAYKKSALTKHNIFLYILGSGPDKKIIIDLIQQEKLINFIHLIDFTPNPVPFIKSALFTVLTSNYEGFPMSIIESLTYGTPVVSVDCKSGPSEIIQNRVNGLLVQKNELDFISALNEMVDNRELLNYCKAHSKKSISHLHPEIITKKWQYLLNTI